MNDAEPTGLWAQLRQAGLAEGELPAATDAVTPWYIRTMLGIAGWIGAMFLLAFIAAGFAFVMKSVAASLLLGAMLCVAAAALFRLKANNDFASQFAFAVSLAGQGLIFSAFVQHWSAHFNLIASAMLLLETALFLAIANFLHRVWVASYGIYAAVFILNDLGLHAYTPALLLAAFAWLWLNEFSLPQRASLLRALGYGLTLLVLLTLFFSAIHGMDFFPARGNSAHLTAIDPWIGAGLIGAVLLASVLQLLDREGAPATTGMGRAALGAAAILALLSLKAPGIGIAVTILLVGHAQGNSVLTGLGILGLLAYLAHYYYALDLTLLEKSALLTCSGAALLAARLALKRIWPEERHA